MSMYAVWTLKRGVLNPPERLTATVEAAVYAAAKDRKMQVGSPTSNEELWRMQGFADGFIKRKVRRQVVAA